MITAAIVIHYTEGGSLYARRFQTENEARTFLDEEIPDDKAKLIFIDPPADVIIEDRT